MSKFSLLGFPECKSFAVNYWSSRLGQVLLRRHRTKELAAWRAAGRVGPTPYLTKILTIRRHAVEHGIRVFVETGTYLGEMINAQEGNF